MTNRPLRVFLCHSSNDKATVRELYQKLRAEPWIQPWLSEEDIFPGDDWNLEIQKAIRESDAILVCLSRSSITKEGYVQREIKTALDYSDEKPEKTIYIIPVRLEECKPPERLSKWQYADYFEGQREKAFQRLLISLKKRADTLGVKSSYSEGALSKKKDVALHKFYRREIHLEYKINADAKVVSNYLSQNYASNSVFVEIYNSVLQVEKIEALNPAEHDVFQYGFVARGYKTTATHEHRTADKPVADLMHEMFVITVSQGQKDISILSFDTDVKHAHMFTTGLIRELGKAFSVELLNPSQYVSARKEEKDVKKEQNGTEKYLDDFYSKHAKKLEELVTDKLSLSNGMEFMRIPAGQYLKGFAENLHKGNIPYEYWMARFLTTNELYDSFAVAKGKKHPIIDWKNKKDHPVVLVSWNDVMEYCKWLNGLLNDEIPSGMILRPPTEDEWEKSARGTDGHEYPWGDEFNMSKCNTKEGGRNSTTSVGLFSPMGDSPYGCADMTGNVWEWTNSLHKKFTNEGNLSRVTRGGSWEDEKGYARTSYRDSIFLLDKDERIGFRLAIAPPLPS